MNRAVLITGMGCVSGLGVGVAESWRRLKAGEGAIRPLSRGGIEGCAAAIEDVDALVPPASEGLRRLGRLDPLSLFTLIAAGEALEQAGLTGSPSLDSRTAVVVGCGSGGNATIDTAYQRLFGQGQAKVHPQTIPSSMIAAPSAHVAMLHGIHGPAFTISSACASSAHALGEAMYMIRAGRVDVAIVGGAEACLNRGSWTGWQSLGVLTPDTCRPFSRGRQGMVLGEGAAMLVLESEDHAQARGAAVLGRLAGYGASSDAGQMTAPDAAGMAAALLAAHQHAGVALDGPLLVSAHGTGTALNDATEAAALRAVYGDWLDRHCVIATKSAHGHMIGAGGAMEFLLGMKALHDGFAPPTLGHLGPDPDCEVPLAIEGQDFIGDALVSSSFAFGGLNAVLIGTRA